MWSCVTEPFHLTLFSGFIPVVAGFSTAFFLMDEYYSMVLDHILFIHLSISEIINGYLFPAFGSE